MWRNAARPPRRRRTRPGTPAPVRCARRVRRPPRRPARHQRRARHVGAGGPRICLGGGARRRELVDQAQGADGPGRQTAAGDEGHHQHRRHRARQGQQGEPGGEDQQQPQVAPPHRPTPAARAVGHPGHEVARRQRREQQAGGVRGSHALGERGEADVEHTEGHRRRRSRDRNDRGDQQRTDHVGQPDDDRVQRKGALARVGDADEGPQHPHARRQRRKQRSGGGGDGDQRDDGSGPGRGHQSCQQRAVSQRAWHQDPRLAAAVGQAAKQGSHQPEPDGVRGAHHPGQGIGAGAVTHQQHDRERPCPAAGAPAATTPPERRRRGRAAAERRPASLDDLFPY